MRGERRYSMFSYELIVNGAAVRVTVAQIEAGLYRATVQGANHIQAHGETPQRAAEKAAMKASYQADTEAA